MPRCGWAGPAPASKALALMGWVASALAHRGGRPHRLRQGAWGCLLAKRLRRLGRLRRLITKEIFSREARGLAVWGSGRQAVRGTSDAGDKRCGGSASATAAGGVSRVRRRPCLSCGPSHISHCLEADSAILLPCPKRAVGSGLAFPAGCRQLARAGRAAQRLRPDDPPPRASAGCLPRLPRQRRLPGRPASAARPKGPGRPCRPGGQPWPLPLSRHGKECQIDRFIASSLRL
jgi:hypothetical protein